MELISMSMPETQFSALIVGKFMPTLMCDVFSPKKQERKKKDCYDGHCPRLLTAGHRHKGPARNEQRPERKMNHDARWCVKSLNMFYDMNLGHFVSIRAALSSAINASGLEHIFLSRLHEVICSRNSLMD